MGEVGEVIPEKQQNEEVEIGKIVDEEEITTVLESSVNQNGGGEVTNGIHSEDQQEEIGDDVEMEEEEDDEDEDRNNNDENELEIEDEEVSQSYDESTKNTEDEVSNGVNGNDNDNVDQMETDDSQSQPAAENKVVEEVEVIGSDDEGDEGSEDPLATKDNAPTETMEVDSGETLPREKIVESVELSDDEDRPTEPTPSEKPASNKQAPPPPTQVDDDDDDDCVVIDDDDDEPQMIDQQKNFKVRSFASMDEPETPPSKRQRTSGIQIKDARSLISSPSTTITPVNSKTPQTPASVTNTTPSVQIYPVGLRASSNTTSPPKLVPVSQTNTSASTPTSTNVKDLLPGLTDDMFVLEAPSFIVPYIYEKPPENTLLSVVKKLEETFDFKSIEDDEKENQLDEDVEKAIDEASKAVSGSEDPEKGGKKKSKKSGDDSWSEGSDGEGQEEDEDSDSVERTKVLIKDAGNELAVLKNAIKPTTTSPKAVVPTGTQKAGDKVNSDNFFESPLGKFFTDLGIGFVQEFVQADLLKVQKRKLRRTQHSGEASVIDKAVTALKENLQTSRKHNAPFRFNMKRCEYCSFKSESALSLALHYQTPHMNGVMYRCNFCPFEIRSSHEIIQHMDYVHNVKARIEKNPSYHACPNCPYEENGKAKLARHAIVCAKKFRPEVNLAPPQDWEAPAKIPRVKPRHGLVGTATAYQAMAAQAAAQKAVLETMQMQQAQRMNMQNSKSRTKNKTSNGGINKNNAALRNVPGLLPNNFQIQGGQLIQVANTGFSVLTNTSSITLQSAQNSKRHSTGSQQPSISITPLPRHSNSPAASTSNSLGTNLKMLPAGLKPGQSPAAGAKFVICEICDGYIKDLEQLRNHMQWMHKVKIHPKMIYNRPPLNCQKCQFRFFTDQGLERHLLGSHGLVTSSMQEAANKGKDSGRCPVCGRMYQWKLLNHVSRDHHMTLKPAHLSYKCTVCTATFGMYKQFETHVYTAHSTVAKKQLDGKKSSSGGGGGSARSSSTNDNLLKPLKINDEITIIPQPSSKTTRTIDID